MKCLVASSEMCLYSLISISLASSALRPMTTGPHLKKWANCIILWSKGASSLPLSLHLLRKTLLGTRISATTALQMVSMELTFFPVLNLSLKRLLTPRQIWTNSCIRENNLPLIESFALIKMGQSLFLWDWIELSKYRESRASEEMKMIA